MNGLPLHPAFAHLPLGIASLLPILTLIWCVLYYKQVLERKSFLLIMVLHGILALSINLTSARGEADARALKKHLDIPTIEKLVEHEQKAEAFMFFSYFAFIIIAGITYQSLSRIKLAAVIVLQGLLLHLGVNVGQSGGMLIYQYDIVPVLKSIIN